MREFSGGNTRKMLLNSLKTTLHHVFKFVKLRQFLRLKKNLNTSGIPTKDLEVSYDMRKSLEPYVSGYFPKQVSIFCNLLYV